jgi:predicted transcriptional regulator
MALEGSLREFPVTDIIQMVSLSKQTGAAEIRANYRGRNVVARLYFKGGNAIHAELENLPAMEAALTFFTFDDGEFTFLGGEAPAREELRGSNEMLVMQGINRSDEFKAIREILPTDDIIPLLVDNPSVNGAAINLRPEEWRLLTFINGQDDVAAIAKRSNLSNHVTERIIAHLLQVGLIEKKQRNLKYILYAELGELAVTQLGTTAKNLLDQSYQRTGLTSESDVTPEQAMAIVDNFQKLARLLVGPTRTERLAEQMRERIRTCTISSRLEELNHQDTKAPRKFIIPLCLCGE